MTPQELKKLTKIQKQSGEFLLTTGETDFLLAIAERCKEAEQGLEILLRDAGCDSAQREAVVRETVEICINIVRSIDNAGIRAILVEGICRKFGYHSGMYKKKQNKPKAHVGDCIVYTHYPDGSMEYWDTAYTTAYSARRAIRRRAHKADPCFIIHPDGREERVND